MPARPGDDALLRPSYAGKSILDVLWEDLLRCVDQLMSDDNDWSESDRARCQGRAEGVAWSIAVMTQYPRKPDINTVKQEAMERWDRERG